MPKIGNIPWNKGLKYSKYTESSAKRFRRDKDYYLRELKNNAIRNKGRNIETNRALQIRQWRQDVQEITGAGRKRQEWLPDEIDYLKKNYKNKSLLDMALFLERSFMSVSHKLSRLGLITYHKWN